MKRNLHKTKSNNIDMAIMSLAMVLILLLIFFTRFHRTTILGIQADEGVHITVAERVAAGDIIYKELFENRMPGVEWLLSVFSFIGWPILFWGRWMTSITSLMVGAALIPAGRLILHDHRGDRQLSSYAAGGLSALLFGLTPLAIFWSRFIMLEPYAAAASALSIAAVAKAILRQSKRQSVPTRWWFFSGALAGLATFAKQSSLTLLVVFLLLFVLIAWLNRPRLAVRSALFWFTGVLAILNLFFLVLLFQGAITDFMHQFSGADRLDPLANFANKVESLSLWLIRQPLAILALIGGLVALWKRRLMLLIPLIWVIIEITALLSPPILDLKWGGLSHYALPLIVASSLLAGAGTTWGWLSLRRRPRLRKAFAGVIVTISLVTVSSWLIDFNYVIRLSDYPQANLSEELKIADALAISTDPDSEVLVFANSAFYHLSKRQPAAKFFHYPGYLSSSQLAHEAEVELLGVLSEGSSQAVLTSRLHLDFRLPKKIVEAIWKDWQPVAEFPYQYQKDVILFLPMDEMEKSSDVSALFNDSISLTSIEIPIQSEEVFLVRLEWKATSVVSDDYTIFVHILDEEGNLIGQHDGVPVVGYRPRSGWLENESIIDQHWISINSSENKPFSVQLGLYDNNSGLRLPITKTDLSIKDSAVIIFLDKLIDA